MKTYFVALSMAAVLFASCMSTQKTEPAPVIEPEDSDEPIHFTINDEIMSPIINETFEEMEDAVSDSWERRREKPAILLDLCYDERFGPQTVTVIANWIQQEMTMQFVNSRNYKIIDRENLKRIRNEKKFQQAGYVDDKVLVDEGRELGGNYLVRMKITKYNTFEASITNIEKSEYVYVTSKVIEPHVDEAE